MDAPAPPKDPNPEPGERLFAARAGRERAVRWLLGGIIVALIVTSWPTEPRKLEKRAMEFVDASNRADAKGSYEYIAPASREKLTPAAWAAQQRTKWEVDSVEVSSGTDTAVVHLVSPMTKRKVSTRWVRVDGKWYYAP